jgi:hypothetical protein
MTHPNNLHTSTESLVEKLEARIAESANGSPDDYSEQCYRRAMREAIAIVRQHQPSSDAAEALATGYLALESMLADWIHYVTKVRKMDYAFAPDPGLNPACVKAKAALTAIQNTRDAAGSGADTAASAGRSTEGVEGPSHADSEELLEKVIAAMKGAYFVWARHRDVNEAEMGSSWQPVAEAAIAIVRQHPPAQEVDLIAGANAINLACCGATLCVHITESIHDATGRYESLKFPAVKMLAQACAKAWGLKWKN